MLLSYLYLGVKAQRSVCCKLELHIQLVKKTLRDIWLNLALNVTICLGSGPSKLNSTFA